MGNDDAAGLAAGTLEQLGTGLSRVQPDQSGYNTAEDHERLEQIPVRLQHNPRV